MLELLVESSGNIDLRTIFGGGVTHGARVGMGIRL